MKARETLPRGTHLRYIRREYSSDMEDGDSEISLHLLIATSLSFFSFRPLLIRRIDLTSPFVALR